MPYPHIYSHLYLLQDINRLQYTGTALVPVPEGTGFPFCTKKVWAWEMYPMSRPQHPILQLFYHSMKRHLYAYHHQKIIIFSLGCFFNASLSLYSASRKRCCCTYHSCTTEAPLAKRHCSGPSPAATYFLVFNAWTESLWRGEGGLTKERIYIYKRHFTRKLFQSSF